jgi:hypothetical protein
VWRAGGCIGAEHRLLEVAGEDAHAMKRLEAAVIGILSLVLVVGAMAALDETVRANVTAVLNGDFSVVTAYAGASIHDGRHAFWTFAYQANGYKSLSVFAVGASVLVLFMRKL